MFHNNNVIAGLYYATSSGSQKRSGHLENVWLSVRELKWFSTSNSIFVISHGKTRLLPLFLSSNFKKYVYIYIVDLAQPSLKSYSRIRWSLVFANWVSLIFAIFIPRCKNKSQIWKNPYFSQAVMIIYMSPVIVFRLQVWLPF